TYEEADKQNPPSKEDLALFVGSSSIVMWKSLEQDFKAYNVLNRGFGGSHNSDVIYYFGRIVKPYNPSKVIYYEGDNDIASEEQAFSDFITVAGMIKDQLPDTKVAILSAKPSPSRWHLRQQYEEYNERVRIYCLNEPQFEYADIFTPMIEKYGRPEGELFVSDSLHMSANGYKIWKKIINDFITK
ncbi:GDSL-type esterase/lipase family protein, partial [Bacteroidota bacterium]